MKIMALYLPQFHETPENNEWWGEGFTEWTNVKNARPLFEGHNQPRIPLHDNYYNLLEKQTLKWQVELAKEYGVYGFSFYHYWFSGKLMLEKPMEMFLKDRKNCNLPFCICWANGHWTNAWVADNPKVLMEQEYGDRAEWKQHFEYLLPFFKDDRYIKNDGKPFMFIYRPEFIDSLNEMIDYWKELAVEYGFPGLDIASRQKDIKLIKNKDDSRIDYSVELHPGDANDLLEKKSLLFLKKIWRKILLLLTTKFHKNVIIKRKKSPILKDYDELWKAILKKEPESSKCIPGAFVDWDNTPRYGMSATIYQGATPKKFQHYLEKQIVRARDVYKKDMMFMFAWNEWAEGGYLEPDETNGHGYLEAIKNALNNTGEFPMYPN